MGENIYAWRCNLRLSQKELAEKCGVSQQMISFLEINQRTPSLKLAKCLAAVFGITVDELISGRPKNADV
ncbi:MAG: helix-turn-helix transcriptional regulator [Oscillospiraceae bacterium]|nr:helix-turn-helix transcriptional regulator [Oscillospiraceae bacterium]